MYKNLTIACVTISAVVALINPAAAAAVNDPDMLDSNGLVAVNSQVVTTNVGSAVFWNTSTNLQLAVCSSVRMTGRVLANWGIAEIELSSVTFSGTGPVNADNGLKECTGEIGNSYVTLRTLPLCLRSTSAMSEDEFSLLGGSCAIHGSNRILLGSTTAGECEYESAFSIKGDYTTGVSAAEDAKLTTRDTSVGSGMTLIRGGFLCPSSMMLGMTFTMETDGTNSPIWIS